MVGATLLKLRTMPVSEKERRDSSRVTGLRAICHPVCFFLAAGTDGMVVSGLHRKHGDPLAAEKANRYGLFTHPCCSRRGWRRAGA